MPRGQAVAHKLPTKGESSMETKPSKTVYTNGGQTKVTIIGRWVEMSPAEVQADFERRLEAGDPWAVNLNETLCTIDENIARQQQGA